MTLLFKNWQEIPALQLNNFRAFVPVALIVKKVVIKRVSLPVCASIKSGSTGISCDTLIVACPNTA